MCCLILKFVFLTVTSLFFFKLNLNPILFSNKFPQFEMERFSGHSLNEMKERRRKILLLKILQDHPGYRLEQHNGQRIFGKFEETPKNSEVFIGKLPKDLYEDELIPYLETVARVRKLRLMLDFNGRNRGYAFATFSSTNEALTVVNLLNETSIRPGRKIGVYLSVDNRRLFVGGVPTHVTSGDLRKEMEKFVEGLEKVILYENPEDKGKNRGFAFLEFIDHRRAAIARRKLSPGSFLLLGVQVIIDWADPLPVVDPAHMNDINKLYIRNLDPEWDHEVIWKGLSQHISIDNVLKVHKINDFCFVHFQKKEHAQAALHQLEGKKIQGREIEITWARPKCYAKENRLKEPAKNFCTSLPPRMRKKVLMKRMEGKASLSSSSKENLEANEQIFNFQKYINGNYIFNENKNQILTDATEKLKNLDLKPVIKQNNLYDWTSKAYNLTNQNTVQQLPVMNKIDFFNAHMEIPKLPIHLMSSEITHFGYNNYFQ